MWMVECVCVHDGVCVNGGVCVGGRVCVDGGVCVDGVCEGRGWRELQGRHK